MSEPRKRRWFQIHLSTALVLMLVSGELLWANLGNKYVSRYERVWGFVPDGRPEYPKERFWWNSETFVLRGWPLDFYSYSLEEDSQFDYAFQFDKFACDMLVAILILATSAASLEFLILRREARKP